MTEVRVVSYSELDTARQCFFKHQLGYQERWVAPTTSPALSRGTLTHNVLETHYRMLKEIPPQSKGDELVLRQVVREVKREWLYDPTTGRQTEEQELVEWMYDGYVEHYGADPQWKVLAVEHAPVIPLPTPRGTRSRYRLKLKIDLIVKWDGKVWIVDHKTGKDLPRNKELDINDQFGLYTWAMRQLGKPVLGSVHNALRSHRNKDQERHPQPLEERFSRTRMFRADAELNSLAVDAYWWARMAWQARGGGDAPRSPNEDTCKWRCDFLDACLYGRKGGDTRSMLRDMGYVQDPTRH